MAASGRPVPELERVRNLCYQQGKEFLSTHPESRALLFRLEKECPHVSVRDLVLLFHLGDPELAKATAHRLEYNANHPRPMPPGRDQDRDRDSRRIEMNRDRDRDRNRVETDQDPDRDRDPRL